MNTNYQIIKLSNGENIICDIKEQSGSSIFPQFFLDGQYIGGYSEFVSLHSSGKLLSN